MPKLGLRENLAQFLLLVVVNAFVGAMVGMERSILPALAEGEFHLVAKSAILSFILVFGLSKAVTNYIAGRWSEKVGRKRILIAGWAIALPVPLILIFANHWYWILFANILLGVSQGLTWSMTVIMKIDLVGPRRRGFAMGINEFAGYLAVAGSAWATGYLASRYGVRPVPFYAGIFYAVSGLLLSTLLVRETLGHTHLENNADVLSAKQVFIETTFKNKNLSSITQAGLVNNLNDGMAWGLFPIYYASQSLSLKEIAYLAAIYPATWGICQIFTGHLSDLWGRKWMITLGMWTQASAIVLIALTQELRYFILGNLFLGLGTGMVYPTLLAAIGDTAGPRWRASAVGVYRFWRDFGYAAGAVLAGFLADFFGMKPAILGVAALTAFSGSVVAKKMSEEDSNR